MSSHERSIERFSIMTDRSFRYNKPWLLVAMLSTSFALILFSVRRMSGPMFASSMEGDSQLHIHRH